MWDIEFTDEFGEWWGKLSEDEQESLTVCQGAAGLGAGPWATPC